MGPHWRDVACPATLVGVDRSVGAVASVVDRKPRDVAVQAAVPLLVSTFGVQTDGQVEAVGTSRKMHFPSCGSGRIGRTGRKLNIMTEVTIAPTSGRTAPNPLVVGAHHANTLLYNV